ncbi:MAG: DUF167 domain-containing protein [Rhodospirillales bacterium]|nr:DUF167 domain-containing protein [Rhodospirillales bacterium]MDE2199577.1 DUF167 domain-containing protein [Rhodospirillales bacterium]MDE2575312.1 DUF167 domain-containing protein [Rhodospirillales bacterium]
MMTAWREVADGVVVAVKVQPKSRRPGVQGTEAEGAGAESRLRIAVAEAPEDGRATRAACAALARALDLPASAVALHSGAASRQKMLHVTGDPTLLAARLGAL